VTGIRQQLPDALEPFTPSSAQLAGGRIENQGCILESDSGFQYSAGPNSALALYSHNYNGIE
jgi:hypothetical protein